MYNGKLILTIIIVFVLLVTLPMWYGKVAGGAASPPKLEPPPGGQKQCVEPIEYMRKNHVNILKTWKDAVVRDGQVQYVASDGKQYTMSLTNTCLDCHSNKANFCDRCHNYVKLSPRCWDCHNVPKGETP